VAALQKPEVPRFARARFPFGVNGSVFLGVSGVLPRADALTSAIALALIERGLPAVRTGPTSIGLARSLWEATNDRWFPLVQDGQILLEDDGQHVVARYGLHLHTLLKFVTIGVLVIGGVCLMAPRSMSPGQLYFLPIAVLWLLGASHVMVRARIKKLLAEIGSRRLPI
jgi:hypothetical protein